MYRTLKFVLGGALLAVPAIAVGQATQPSNYTYSSQQAPANAVKSTVLLLPIAAPTGSYSWVGRAIQQDIEVDLSQMGIARVIAPASGPQVDDSQAALKAARDAGASHVVYAQAQMSGNQMRVTGQVLDASNGQSLAAIKMTAPADNLFPLEDGLAIQIAHALPGGPEALASAAAAQNQQQQQQPQQQQAQPAPTVVYGQPSTATTVQPAPQYYSTAPDYTPYTTNTYVYSNPYDYSYGYGYPYYGYGSYYPFGFYGGIGIYGGGNYYNHYRGGFGYRGGGFHGGGHVGGGRR